MLEPPRQGVGTHRPSSAHMKCMITNDTMRQARTLTHSNVYYEVDIESPRAASRRVRVTFPRSFADRIARADGHSGYMLEVSDGQYSRLRSADQVKLPRSLEQPLVDAAEGICAYEHSLAVAAGVLPLDPERIKFYSGHIGRFEAGKVRRADAVLATFDSSIPMTPELIATVVALATEFVPVDEHETKMEDAADKLEAAKTKYEDLESRSEESIRTKANAEQAVEDWEETAGDLWAIEERLRNRDLIGAYGNDDFEKIIDLMQPVLDRCALV